MIHVVQGRRSKQIANDIGISEPTVKVHRSHLMRKMNTRSLAELGRMSAPRRRLFIFVIWKEGAIDACLHIRSRRR
jgi:hypothetical protein